MKNPIGIILAAGRGSRMKNLTDSKPKCLIELDGRSLLHWQIASLRQANLKEIIVVTGYKGELLQGNFETIVNPRWAETNMVQTLLYALNKTRDVSAVVSYADIVYKYSHVEALLKINSDIAITYDKNWESLWRLRNSNPLEDAETFREYKGVLQEIGGKPSSLDEIQGQYMGLLFFSPKGQEIITNYLAMLPRDIVDKMDMTSLLRNLLTNNIRIDAVAVSGGWCECDTERDIFLYQKQLKNGNWQHDWR